MIAKKYLLYFECRINKKRNPSDCFFAYWACG